MRLLALIMAFPMIVAATSYSQTVHLGEKKGEIDYHSESKMWTFETDIVGVTALGFTPYVGKWQIRVNKKAPSGDHVFAQLMENSRSSYNVVLFDGGSFQNIDLSVKLKSVAGRIDLGGGPVWRAKDENNYYIARYNPLEQNFRVYKVVEGQRSQLQSATIKQTPGWHEVRVTMEGARIMCYYDGKLYLDVQDSTFKGPGQIGLWTKADAQTYFDDLTLH